MQAAAYLEMPITGERLYITQANPGGELTAPISSGKTVTVSFDSLGQEKY
jgi:hypothetical protein